MRKAPRRRRRNGTCLLPSHADTCRSRASPFLPPAPRVAGLATVLRPFSFLYLISKCAFNLLQLRLNDELAVGRAFMCCKVVAVVVLRRVKFHQRINRGYNLLPLALFYIFICFFLLSLIVVENYRAVLWSHVIALPVTRCGIMRNKKHIKEFAVR